MGVIPTDCRVGGFSISCLLWISLNSKCSALNSPSSAISIITIHTLHYVTISPVLYMANLSRGKPLWLERKLIICGNSSMLVYLYILSIDTRPYIRSGTMHKNLCKFSRIALPWFTFVATPLSSHYSPQLGKQCFVKYGFMA